MEIELNILFRDFLLFWWFMIVLLIIELFGIRIKIGLIVILK